MLRRYRNALIDTIKAAGLNPQDFEASDVMLEALHAFQLVYKNTPMMFAIRNSPTDAHHFDCAFTLLTPGYPLSDYRPGSGFATFDRMNTYFMDWLTGALTEFLEDEVTPDLWAQLEAGAVVPDLMLGSDMTNTPFSQAEREQIAEGLRQVQLEISKHPDVTPPQAAALSDRVEYLIDSSRRLGRKDWLASAVGALMGVALQSGLTSDAARQLLRLAGEALRWVSHSPLMLP